MHHNNICNANGHVQLRPTFVFDLKLCLIATVHWLSTDVEWQHIIADSAYLFVLLSFMPAILRPSIVACTRQSQPACQKSPNLFANILLCKQTPNSLLIHNSVLHQAPCMIHHILMHLAHHQSSQVPYLYASATPSCCASWESSQVYGETVQWNALIMANSHCWQHAKLESKSRQRVKLLQKCLTS